MPNRRTAVITGAANGIGAALASKLAGDGYDLGLCDVDEEGLFAIANVISDRNNDCNVIVDACDVSDRTQVEKFRDKIVETTNTDSISLLINNAAIVGGNSFIKDPEVHWDQTFSVCWNGVYNCTRVFMPALIAAEEAHIVNISSANGFWASSSFNTPLSAYSTAKFAIKGFTESLLLDTRLHAPHVKPILVMLGQVSTKLAANSSRYLGIRSPLELTDEELEKLRLKLVDPMKSMPVQELRQALFDSINNTNENAPTTPETGVRKI